ncbi:MAG: hypothetical protein IPN69_24170 [Acidobacteria bacterium]|nr:hypothetical protein [Acidobacteriota bacterium]MBK8149445.1 hypothetical protein [Acidobacteriota bacterium]MBK8813806.1 hypothetical protein [Acidobacteriota bacterium]
MTRTHECPICRKPADHWDRYPKQVCTDCASRTSDQFGRGVLFSNDDLAGGLVATYNDDGAPYASPYCWIDGVACIADEHRFGGIVIEVE